MNAPRILTTSVLLLLLTNLLPAAEPGWEKLPPLPEPNGGFVCGEDHGRVVVAGGTNWAGGRKNWLRAVHVLDPVKLSWETVNELGQPLAYGVAGRSAKGMMAGGALVIMGGYTGEQGFLRQVWMENGSRLVRDALPAEAARALSAGGWIDGEMILCGGSRDPADLAGARRDTLAVDARGNVRKLADRPGPGFVTAASAVTANQLFVFGGAAWDATRETVRNLADASAFRPADNAWRQLRTLPFAVRGCTAAALSEGRIYLAGGYKSDEDGFTDEAWIYDIGRDEYRPARALPYRAMVSLVVCDGFLYCLGGEDKKQSRTDAAFRIAITDLLK
jgi:hypothetical protein